MHPIPNYSKFKTSPNHLHGLGGNDNLSGGESDDHLYGGDGIDTISGSGGADYLHGGIGNDILNGGLGADVYWFERGDGADKVTDSDPDQSAVDFLRFGTGITVDQLWFTKVGSSLKVSVIGTGDSVTVSSWYSSSANRLERLQTADGKTITDAQVQNLVNAMAAFAAPPIGQTSLNQAQSTALLPVISANWA